MLCECVFTIILLNDNKVQEDKGIIGSFAIKDNQRLKCGLQLGAIV